ncbi:FKBP-type peptidyl-prolyl cis-trans isomerase [uncultured Ferrimonas sp.]|uniref:FKBP-type peptidyl-prolyl cis-trans isomerase n=1 Tax=uncultured Ferrimonas sp. TaxID=432640 RepID=UPI0026364756|nr:FKBP-type peptidyl-prolyl cis-trans isomerase [uncultured Ferrimonas sp.]
MKLIIKPLVVSLALTGGCSAAVMAQTSDLQQESYAIGASMGKYVVGQMASQQEFGLSFESEPLIAGFADAINGLEKMDKDALVGLLNDRAQLLNQRQQEREAALRKQLSQESRDYLANNSEKAGVTVTESGLQYEVLVAGDGVKPAREDAVTVHYKGSFINGNVFQDTHQAGEPQKVALINTIAGWEEGLQLMPVGSTYRFTIPAALGYGDEGMGAIPGGAAVVFDIELLDTKKPGQAHQGVDMSKGMGGMGMGGMKMNMGMMSSPTLQHSQPKG